jgi:hypothetical protein
MADSDDWLKRYEQRQKEGQKYAEKLLAYVLPVLRFLGVEKVEIHYDGSGDEGQIQAAVLTPPQAAALPEGLAESLETICAEFLPGGWEINEGSQGCLTIVVAEGSHDLAHEWNEEGDYDDDWE